MLVQCKHKEHNKTYLSFDHESLSEHVEHMREPVRDALQAHLLQAMADDAADSDDRNNTPSTPLTFQPVQVAPVQTPVSDKPVPSKARQVCTIQGAPNCRFIFDKLALMTSEIRDKVNSLKSQLQKVSKHCDKTLKNINAQIATLLVRIGDAQKDLADDTKIQIENDETVRQKTGELNDVTDTYEETLTRCKRNIRKFQGEVCGVKKVRSELYIIAKVEMK